MVVLNIKNNFLFRETFNIFHIQSVNILDIILEISNIKIESNIQSWYISTINSNS